MKQSPHPLSSGLTLTPKFFGVSSQSERGFTVVEFVIVVLFIGVLAVIAVNTFTTARINDRDERRIADISVLQEALADYFDEFGGYPSSIETELVKKGFLNTLPLDPSIGDLYLYSALNTGCTSYHLGAILENKQHEALTQDMDVSAGLIGTNCPDGADGISDFEGTDPIYDVKP